QLSTSSASILRAIYALSSALFEFTGLPREFFSISTVVGGTNTPADPVADLSNWLKGRGNTALLTIYLLTPLQFLLLFIIMGLRGTVGWVYPYFRLVKSIKGNTAYLLIYGCAALSLCVFIWNISIIDSIVVILISALMLILPILASGPIWVMKELLDTEPENVLRSPFVLAQQMKGLSFEFPKHVVRKTETEEHQDRPRQSSPEEPEAKYADQKQEETMEEPASSTMSYDDACHVLGVFPRPTDAAALRSAYRNRMRLVRGDQSVANQINRAFEVVLDAHGWTR
ncbi:MAG: hypothetical protein AAFO98_10330, partial [Pseudomonadota bacterium]